MTNTATIEDLFESILGLVLGGAAGQYELANSGGQSGSGKSGINDAFRPTTVAGKGFWLIAESDSLVYVGGWAPEYDKDAVTFYTWTQDGMFKEITRLTVWVGVTNRDTQQGQNFNTDNADDVTNPTANPVVVLGNAWELMLHELPKVAGPGATFDPDSIEAVRQVLTALSTQATNLSTELTTEANRVHTNSDDFRGSAEAAWYHQVQVTNSFLSDIDKQHSRWDTALGSAKDAAAAFVAAVNKAASDWLALEPQNTWSHPYRVIAAMFNQSTLSTADPGPSNAWALGSQYADAGGNTWTDMHFRFTLPSWLDNLSIDPFDIAAWTTVDQLLRAKWVKHLRDTWQQVIDAAGPLIAAFHSTHNPLFIADPAPVSPLPKPKMPNGDIPNPFANMPNPFANMPNPFANMPNPFANMPNPFANMGNPFANMPSGLPNAGANNPFANQPFLGNSNPFANADPTTSDPRLRALAVQSPFAGDTNPFAGTSPLGPALSTLPAFASGSPMLGTLTPEQLDQLQADGGLNNMPLTPQQAAFLNQNGLGPVPPGATLGELTPTQLNALQRAGLLDQTPISTAQLSDLGLPTTSFAHVPSPQELGDLTPKQLNQLLADGLLKRTLLTPQEGAFLQQHGLGTVHPGETLGELSPDQLDALQKGGLLNQTPVTPDELTDLGLGATSTVDTSLFPTGVNGVDVGNNLPLGNLPLGDVSGPGALYTGNGGVGTGGLSSLPGVGGTAGGLSASNLGTDPIGVEPAVTSAEGTVVGETGMYLPGMMGGGMPYMPGMFGGMNPGQGQQRDRTRSTWLKEDEEVWGTEPDVAPAVVGRKGRGSVTNDPELPPEEPPTAPGEIRPYRRR
jgi:hypothetical protein